MPNPIPVEIQQKVRHGYFASVSWVDSQIGRVLQALDDMSLADDTLVVLFGDHGYQLGEHDSWHKMTNWELAVRVPLIIRAPWKPASAGKRSHAFVELVDLYRTISELVGAPSPGDDIEGVSFASLFDSPDLNALEAALALNKTPAAYSQYTRCLKSIDAANQWDNNTCSKNAEVQYMGYSVRVLNWRYTAWMKWEDGKAKWESKPYAVELYDHHNSDSTDGTGNDFNQCEIENVADENPDIVQKLQEQLKKMFEK
ncbi:PREDICTED: iduronate 2-sulfatase-like [Amphimedon queenslandica]|uniref:Sulfatase N-terminal domain-containing protein n=1 Tax=Amphimedon queenslandica TaxID=400682 RepID=A0AAN0JQE1_AMPQE|nr:PREDICTED: iduronate 2-sulfatase-like [Amphimedon queenslandica]|eukprot:XP_019859030.1 PREDICTED: iduronate 2-sulfatase-like [Amphimedon queenslandica]